MRSNFSRTNIPLSLTPNSSLILLLKSFHYSTPRPLETSSFYNLIVTMVGYGKYLSHRQNNAHQRLSPYCPLCGSVVLTTQAVTARREIHLAQEEASRARPNQQYLPMNQPPNMPNNIPPRPTNNLIFPNNSFDPVLPTADIFSWASCRATPRGHAACKQ